MSTLLQDQAKASRQNTPGYDALGDAIPAAAAAVPVNPTDTQLAARTAAAANGGKVPRYPTTGADAPGSTVDGAESAYQAASAPEDPATVAKRVEANFAGVLAAIKTRYAALTNAQGIKNEAASGRTRATQAASGTLGGDFGNEALANTDESNQAALGSIAAEEANAEAGVGSQINTQVESEIQSQRGTSQKALQDRITYLSGVADKARSQIGTISATTDLSTLPQDTYDSLYQKAGFDTPEEFNAYYEASRNAALQGVKLVGDSATGYYMPSVGKDGTVSYKNVIGAKQELVSGSQYGNFAYDPTSNTVKTISPGQSTQIKSAGGQLWAVDVKTNTAKPITPKYSGVDKVGWSKASVDQQLAVQRTIEAEAKAAGKDPAPYLTAVQQNPDAFLTTLNGAVDAGYYVPVSVSQTGSPMDTSAADAAAATATDAADAAANGQ